jgi:signal transduction histidine kinase
LERGFIGLRFNGNEGWLKLDEWNNFLQYERELNHSLANKNIIVLCTYPLENCTAADVLDVALVHESAVCKRTGRWEILEVPENKKTKAQIQMINEELEERASERTAQLEAANKQLRKLSTHLQNIQENERTAIAREIHDALGQELTGLKMEVAWLNKKLPDNAVLKEKTKEILSLITKIIQTVKEIAVDLRPAMLDDLGLVAAIEWHGQEFEKRTGIKLQFHTDLTDLDSFGNLSTHIFRIYQEALTNVARHAHATEVQTNLEEKDGYIKLIIKDNGQGFDPGEEKSNYSLGLIGMYERTLLLHGELDIESSKQAGTVITLKIPGPGTVKTAS